jgi:hypothetical protein
MVIRLALPPAAAVLILTARQFFQAVLSCAIGLKYDFGSHGQYSGDLNKKVLTIVRKAQYPLSRKN